MRKCTLDFDLMKFVGRDERFVASMRYPHNRLFKLDLDDLYLWILSKRPTLKGAGDKDIRGRHAHNVLP